MSLRVRAGRRGGLRAAAGDRRARDPARAHDVAAHRERGAGERVDRRAGGRGQRRGPARPAEPSCPSIATRAATDLGGRVLDPRRHRRRWPTRPAPTGPTTRTSAGPRWPRRWRATRCRARATPTRSTRTCCTRRCRARQGPDGRRGAADAERRRRQLDHPRATAWRWSASASAVLIAGPARRLAAGGHARRGRCEKLADTARSIADGDLEARAPIEGAEEQRAVAGAFNLHDRPARRGRSRRSATSWRTRRTSCARR